jgi:hypothetical protein
MARAGCAAARASSTAASRHMQPRARGEESEKRGVRSALAAGRISFTPAKAVTMPASVRPRSYHSTRGDPRFLTAAVAAVVATVRRTLVSPCPAATGLGANVQVLNGGRPALEQDRVPLPENTLRFRQALRRG